MFVRYFSLFSSVVPIPAKYSLKIVAMDLESEKTILSHSMQKIPARKTKESGMLSNRSGISSIAPSQSVFGARKIVQINNMTKLKLFTALLFFAICGANRVTLVLGVRCEVTCLSYLYVAIYRGHH